MVAFDRCNAKQRDDCVTSDKFNEDLEYSYVQIFDNQESYKHQEHPQSGKEIKRETQATWYPISTSERTDSVKKVTVTEVEQSYYRFGLDFSNQIDTIFQNLDAKSRILPYPNLMLNSVTYEIQSTKYKQVRHEYSFLQYFSNIGGFGSLLLGISTIFNAMESPHLLVASDFLPQKEQQVGQQNFAIKVHSTDSM